MHVLLTTDGSDIALDAVRRGFALLGGATEVTVLSVVGDLAADTGGGIEGPIYTPEQQDEIHQSEEHHAKRAIADTRALLTALAEPPQSITDRIESGDPAGTICMLAGEIAADVVVIGSHGKGFLARVLLGSVSEHVVRHAPCPVLVVRSPA